MGPIWSRQDPDGPHVDPMNLAIWGLYHMKHAHNWLPLFFCCDDIILLCWVMWSIYPYYSGLPHWHWANHMVTPMPVKQPWVIWINWLTPTTAKIEFKTNGSYLHECTQIFTFTWYIYMALTLWSLWDLDALLEMQFWVMFNWLASSDNLMVKARGQMNTAGPYWWEVNIGSVNGLVLSDNKALPEPVTLTYVAIWCH